MVTKLNKKLYDTIISGKADNNIKYTDFQNLIVGLGFEFQHQDGSHRFYAHKTYPAIMNIQPDGNKAKGYQVRQLRNLIKKFNLTEVK